MLVADFEIIITKTFTAALMQTLIACVLVMPMTLIHYTISECSKKNWRMINILVNNVAFLGEMI